MATKVKLTEDQKSEIKALLALKVSDTTIRQKFSLSPDQLRGMKAAATRQKAKVDATVPSNEAVTPTPTVTVDIPVGDLLKDAPEARLVIRLIK